jgi:hypothetical protein
MQAARRLLNRDGLTLVQLPALSLPPAVVGSRVCTSERTVRRRTKGHRDPFGVDAPIKAATRPPKRGVL